MSDEQIDFLSVPVRDLPKAVMLEPGRYVFQIARYFENRVGQKQTQKIDFMINPMRVVDADFQEGDLARAKKANLTYWITDAALGSDGPNISLTEFLTKTLGLPYEDGQTPAELLEMAIGQEFVGRVKIDMEGKNNDIPTAVVDRVWQSESPVF